MIDKLWEQDRIRRRPYWLKITIPFVLSAVATWLSMEPWSMFGLHTPFLFLFLAVFLSACYGGWWSALLSTVGCTAGAIGFIFPQHHRLPSFYSAIMLFLLEGLMLTCLFRLIEEIHERLQHSEARFRGMIEQSAEGFLLTDIDGWIKYAAPGAAGLLGYKINELKRTPLTTLIHPDELRGFEIGWLKLTEQPGQQVNFKHRLKTADDQWLWVEGTASNLLKDPGVQALVFHYRDITRRIQKEKRQEDFVHMASHELKAPITALKGFAQLMRLNHQRENRDKDRSMLDRMEMQLNKLLGLIDDMLDMTRIKTGELHYHFIHFNLVECVNEVVETIQTTTTTHKLIFKPGAALTVHADRDKIGQVINNMVTNAIKYSPGAENVELNIVTNKDSVYVKVKDHGIGIPKNKQLKVFDRFYRVNSISKNRFEGLGLGLYISMEIIKRHCGEMGVDSEEGQGAEFWFSLPLNPLI